MKITPLQQYIILGIFAFFGLAFLYYQFLLKPINNKISVLQTKLDGEKKDLEEAKMIVAKYVEFKKREDSIQRELEWIQNRIPKSIERTKLIEAISFLQSRSNVMLTSFTINPPSSKDSYTEIPINIQFHSDFKGLINFLYQISTSNLLMTAHGLKVTPYTPTTSDDPTLSLSTQIIVSGVQAK